MDVIVAGVGLTPFRKPSEGFGYLELGAKAVRNALSDAGLVFSDIQQAYAGWVYADSTAGQRVLGDVGNTSLPVINVNNNCASGATALYLARQAVEYGAAECVLAFGFEEMNAGALGLQFPDKHNPLERHLAVANEICGTAHGPMTARAFAAAGIEHMASTGVTAHDYAQIAVKSRRHASANPDAVFRTSITADDVLHSPTVFDPLTRLQCCPPTSGAAALILCSTEFARRHGIEISVRIAGQAMMSDTDESFQSATAAVGSGISGMAARQVYEKAAIGPDDIDVVELHDCFTVNEALACEALGLAGPDGIARMISDGDNTHGGRVVVNPSGGLLSKGHPLGATGLAQAYELTEQLRGRAGARQVEGARIGLQHNVGLGSAAVVTAFISE